MAGGQLPPVSSMLYATPPVAVNRFRLATAEIAAVHLQPLLKSL
jgi:hypothetical protein